MSCCFGTAVAVVGGTAGQPVGFPIHAATATPTYPVVYKYCSNHNSVVVNELPACKRRMQLSEEYVSTPRWMNLWFRWPFQTLKLGT
jgi:hypothetical protein